jgi:drug/metabolite transporter (DMT)-like permease
MATTVTSRRATLLGACSTLLWCWSGCFARGGRLFQVNLLNYLWPIWIVAFPWSLLPSRAGGIAALGGALLGFAGVLLARGPDALLRLPERWMPHLLALGPGLVPGALLIALGAWVDNRGGR